MSNESEWTAEIVEKLIGLGDYHALKRLSDAHNSALADERETLEKLRVAHDGQLKLRWQIEHELADARMQLADEEQKVTGLSNELAATRLASRKQLAAESEKPESSAELIEQMLRAEIDIIKHEYQQQLDAERKRYERLLDLAGAQNMGIDNLAKLDELQQQLAAEREEREIISRSRDSWQHQAGVLSEQLADEREQSQKRADEGTKIYLQLTLLEKQLAAEQARCYNDGWVAGLEARDKEMTESERDACHRAEAALAVERENAKAAYKRGEDFARNCCAEEESEDVLRLEQQLDAAVEALKEMLSVYEELHARYDLGDCQATVNARAALAKIGGK